jgi:protein-S-isoprenylcysteine O-methyltransferase Ste14
MPYAHHLFGEGHPQVLPEVTMKERRGEHPFGDAGQLMLLGLFVVVWGGDTFFLHWSTFLSEWVPHAVRMALLGLALLFTLILVLTGHVVISGKERPNQVVDTGAFRYVRHPLYLAALLGYVGATVSSLSLFSVVLWIPIFVFYNYLTSYEEKLLEARFGEAYQEYERRTGKWLPRVRQRG